MLALHNKGVARKISMSQGSHPHMGGYATMREGWEVTVGVTIHGKMSKLRQRGAGGGKLIHEFRTRLGMIYRQSRINELNEGGTVEFELKKAYK